MRFRTFILGLAVVISSTMTWAAKHPVPLDPKADPKTCLECHEDKAKGTHVHSAIQMGCTSCHEVRANKDVTRVKLITTTTSSLCLSCHDNKAEVDGHTMHPPAVRDCVKCHDPHQSANEKQLLKPATGSTKEENLCLTCHEIGVNVPKTGSRHPALDMGCGTCHTTHKNGERGKPEFDYHLNKTVPALCLDCHDAKDEGLQKTHQGQPFGSANCLQCHDPHQSNKPKLMQAFAHNPFEGKMCDTCHQPAKDGKVVLTNSDTRALCVTCHDEQAKHMESAKVQHPGALGDCTACHNPHAGKAQGFLQPDPVKACVACHDAQGEQMKKAHLHKPAFETGCATCHEAHGSNNEHLLRSANTNALCLECHSPEAQPQKVEGSQLVTIYNGKVKLPESYFRSVPQIPIKYGRGHPIESHPVQDQMDPKDVSKVRVKLNCLSCHESHAASQSGLLVKDHVNNMAFCAECHKDLGN